MTAPRWRPPQRRRGWPGEAEAALIDAVFSADDNDPETPRRVAYWRLDNAAPEPVILDDLRELAACDPHKTADFFENHERLADGTPKAEALVAAARALVAAGFTNSTSLLDSGRDGEAASTFCSVPGLEQRHWIRLLALLDPDTASTDAQDKTV